MLKLKRLNFCLSLPFLLLFLVVQFGTVRQSKAQKYFSLPEHARAEHEPLEVDTLITEAAVPNPKAEVIDTCGILPVPSIKLNGKAVKFVSDYLRKNDEDLQSIKKRSARYFKTIEVILQASKVPVELKYLAVIESELKTSAVSHVGAAGMWQFMPATARSLGLKVSAKYDERKQFTKSTKAAAIYIKALHAQFDDWLLVVAAYNSGAGPVYKAIKKAGSRDFWALQKFLPPETRAHVKRYIGAHYFFEKKLSTATLTKAETIRHLKAVAEYKDGLKVIEELKESFGATEDVVVQTNKAVNTSSEKEK